MADPTNTDPPKPKFCGKKGRSGPKPGNLNALKNGSKLNANRLTVGELPASMIAVRREGRAYRRDLEAAVLEAKGTINLTDAHLIDTAAAATITAGICRWLLRNKIETMNTSDIRGCSGDITKAKQQRDAAVRLLNLDVEVDPWADAFDGTVSDEQQTETT